MRLCFFSGDIARKGGTERVTTVIASALALRGYRVSVLSMCNGMVTSFPLHPSVRIASLQMEGRSANFSDIAKWRALRHFVRDERIDLLVDVDTVLSWYSIPATFGLPTKVVSWEHFHRLINVGDRWQRLRRRAGRWLAVRHAACVVTLTTKDRNQYLENDRCGVPILTIPNPATLQPDGRSTPAEKVVLAAGRMVPQKGFDLLLSAWARIASRHSDWKLRIVGSGADREDLIAQARMLMIQDNVEFKPYSSDMSSEYCASSLYVLSSRFEGFGLVLVEAKAFGLPVVSFDCPCGPSDIVRDGTDGLLVPAGDVTALAEALALLMGDDERRRAFGVAAAMDARFALPQVTETWVKLIEQLGYG